MINSVYIHIPFCNKICNYCDFCKFYYNEKWADAYLDALKEEILDRYMDDDINTIYIGGGTPSSLSKKQLNKLFDIIKIFKINENSEITFECNLSDINEELIKLLIKNKVTRLSIGLQSFNKEKLEFLGRTASYKEAKEKINLCKDLGISNINVDLIYATIKDTMKVLKKDLKYIKKLNINHVSTYSLILENNTILHNQGIKPIDDTLDQNMYKLICKKLKKYGFIHYEISNFAKKGFESKHNLVYWNNEYYYGFGLSASGYVEKIRYTNTRNLTQYLKGNYKYEEEILSLKEIMDYEIMLGLRKIKGINLKEFYDKYKVNLQNKYPAQKLVEEKLLIYKEGNIFINPSKLYIMNEILVRMI